MKKATMGLIFIVSTTLGLAQQREDVLYKAKVKKEDVPEVVVEAIETDFPDFVMEEFSVVPIEYVEEDVVVNKSLDPNIDYDTFQVRLTNKGKELIATYDRYGRLKNTVEHLSNVTLPKIVRDAVTKNYPGWSPQKDHYIMVHHRNGKTKERYMVVLEKGKEKQKIYLDGNGKILNQKKN